MLQRPWYGQSLIHLLHCVEKTRTEAADKTMQELLAAEDKSHSVPEGPKKGKKKKKVYPTTSLNLQADNLK